MSRKLVDIFTKFKSRVCHVCVLFSEGYSHSSSDNSNVIHNTSQGWIQDFIVEWNSLVLVLCGNIFLKNVSNELIFTDRKGMYNRHHGYSVTAHPCYCAVSPHPTGMLSWFISDIIYLPACERQTSFFSTSFVMFYVSLFTSGN